jgi:hypothetical protein
MDDVKFSIDAMGVGNEDDIKIEVQSTIIQQRKTIIVSLLNFRGNYIVLLKVCVYGFPKQSDFQNLQNSC